MPRPHALPIMEVCHYHSQKQGYNLGALSKGPCISTSAIRQRDANRQEGSKCAEELSPAGDPKARPILPPSEWHCLLASLSYSNVTFPFRDPCELLSLVSVAMTTSRLLFPAHPLPTSQKIPAQSGPTTAWIQPPHSSCVVQEP